LEEPIQLRRFANAVLTLALLFSTIAPRETRAAFNAQEHQDKHGFGFKQYDEFHDVLHPLQHEALPNKDFKTIRTKSALLIQRGRAIVKLGTPAKVSKDNRAEFITELRKFSRALTKFRNDAKRSSDSDLEISYSAVHDSFEMLAALLPRT
jgi:hypothetical protein